MADWLVERPSGGGSPITLADARETGRRGKGIHVNANVPSWLRVGSRLSWHGPLLAGLSPSPRRPPAMRPRAARIEDLDMRQAAGRSAQSHRADRDRIAGRAAGLRHPPGSAAGRHESNATARAARRSTHPETTRTTRPSRAANVPSPTGRSGRGSCRRELGR